MAHMTERTCNWCKAKFQARTADVNRGWALFCSKSCKAARQSKCNSNGRSGNEFPKDMQQWERDEIMHQAAMDEVSDMAYGASDGDSGR